MAEEQPPSSPPADLSAAASAAQGAGPSAGAIAPEVLKSARNAFKKRWKLTLLDHESRIGRGPMSSGQKSTIAGIAPPDQFPARCGTRWWSRGS